MSHNQFKLLKTKRFAPLFVTQFLGAMNDNLFKQALVVLITFVLAQKLSFSSQTVVMIAAGLFIAPFFLFSALAGQIADKFEKSRIIKWIKLAEIGIMALAGIGFFIQETAFLLFVLFLMGTQSAFFGPLKYGILPDHLTKDELIGGNALIEGATFLAILMGTIGGGLIILRNQGAEQITMILLVIAVLGYAASRFIPKAPSPDPELNFNWNIFSETRNIVRLATGQRRVFLAILGLSWFWAVGMTLLALLPGFTKHIIGGNEYVLNLFMVLFSLGIGLGSLGCNKLLKSEVSAKYVPIGAFGISVFIFDLYLASKSFAVPSGTLINLNMFVGQLSGWRVMIDLFAIAVSAGIYTVPLYAIIQHDGAQQARARTIAANNITNALFMVLGAFAAALALLAGITMPVLLAIMAILNLGVAFYILRLVPEAVLRGLLAGVLKLLYRVQIKGQDNYRRAGKRAIIVVNHVSFLDALLLAVFLPRKPIFAVNTQIANKWWMKPLISLVEAFPLDPTNPMAIKELIRTVEQDRHCVIFPEGRITTTGSLMKIYEGPGMIADKTGADVVPIRIDGAQFSHFSRLAGKLKQRWFPKITITILEPRAFELPEAAFGRQRRQLAGAALYDVMSDMMFATCNLDQTLFQALLGARATHGGRKLVIEDIERKALSYNKLVLGARILGRKLKEITTHQEITGVLLPNASATVVTFFALQASSRIPAMLNFSTGTKNMLAALKAAQIKTVITSKRFIEAAELQDVITALGKGAKIVYLEDVRARINWRDKLAGAFLRSDEKKQIADDPAVVLFTSGSEGTPKGVVLSHRNLMANRYQLGAKVDFNESDIVFNALPVFHSFGLTGGMLLPILSGIRTFLYPSPLHYRIVPALVYDTNATIVFGTDTFLAGYGRVAHPYDFHTVRYVFAGAEKVKDETRRSWADKFGIRILEGYGATETSPVLAVNTPMHYQAGTVGRFLPGISYRLEDVPGIAEGGRLIVSGPNIMKGYLRAEAPGKLEPPEDNEYDTGDIVGVDAFGFVTILGRVKRFAKIGGEMVSLSAVEANVDAIWPDNAHAVVSVEDAKKGEQLILITDCADAQRQTLLAHAKKMGVSELMVPKSIRIIDDLPVLGTGKIDYVAISNMLAK